MSPVDFSTKEESNEQALQHILHMLYYGTNRVVILYEAVMAVQ
jgi:hypothetical protein